MARAVEQRQPQDRVVFAPPAIRDESTEQRKEVHAHHEEMEDLLGAGGAFGGGQRCEQIVREKDGQYAAHPVETETLARLVADDVFDLRRPTYLTHAARLGRAVRGVKRFSVERVIERSITLRVDRSIPVSREWASSEKIVRHALAAAGQRLRAGVGIDVVELPVGMVDQRGSWARGR